MSAQVGMTVVKRFTYRGDATEEYSNQYWLTGSTPADSTAWRALFDALVAQEKTLYPSSVNVVRGYGYSDNDGHKTGDTGPVSPAVWTVDMTISPNAIVPGTLAVTSEIRCPGDAAVWVRWKTSRLNTKGKAVYLRKYFHPAYAASAGAFDQIANVQRDALLAFGSKLWDGSFLSARKITAAGHTDVVVGSGNSTYVTTRTLHRRGKRPGS